MHYLRNVTHWFTVNIYIKPCNSELLEVKNEACCVYACWLADCILSNIIRPQVTVSVKLSQARSEAPWWTEWSVPPHGPALHCKRRPVVEWVLAFSPSYRDTLFLLVSAHTHTRTHARTCTHTHMHKHTYTHTYTHTHTKRKTPYTDMAHIHTYITIIIISEFIQFKILSGETILSVYIHTYIGIRIQVYKINQ